MLICSWVFVLGFFSFFSFLSFFLFLSFFSFFHPLCAEVLNHRITVKNEVEKACYSIEIKIQGSNNWVILEIKKFLWYTVYSSCLVVCIILYSHVRLKVGICSEKCVVRQFCRANVMECTYSNLETWH